MKLKIKMPKRTPPQIRADSSKARFTLSRWGRQSGKTTRGIRKWVWKPLQGRKGAVYWHVLQTYSAAKIAFRRYLKLLKPHKRYLVKSINRSELSVTLIGDRQIFFKSGHNFEDLRTESLDGVIIDEARQQKKELWTMVIYPMLARTKGWADIMTSPNGFDWVYDLEQAVQDDPNWEVIVAPSWEAWWWTQDELAIARKTMTEPEFEQEIGAKYVNIRSGRVYYAFGEHNHRLDCPWEIGKLYSPHHTMVLGMDFNLNPMSWHLGQVSADRWWWFDEIHIENTNTPEAASVLVTKMLAYKAEGYKAEPNLIIIGDATGNATQRTSNKSDYDIVKAALKAAGITYTDRTPEANPPVKDRTNAVNIICKSASGDINLHIHPQNCPHLKTDLDRTGWKAGPDFVIDPGKDKKLGHASDSIGYPIHRITPPKVIRDAGGVKVIQRIL